MVLCVQGIGKVQLLGSQLCLCDLLATSSHRLKTLELLYPVLLPSYRDSSISILTILQNPQYHSQGTRQIINRQQSRAGRKGVYRRLVKEKLV